MFSYFGSKSKIAWQYPPPRHKRIIEPFAGAAAYSLLYAPLMRETVLIEKYDAVYKIWNWLIHDATAKDIRSLPNIPPGGRVSDYKQLTEVERLAMGFAVGWGCSNPQDKFCPNKTGNALYVNQFRKKAIKYLSLIRHWAVIHASYDSDELSYLNDDESTWFIDPPYCKAGKHYKHNKIDYKSLAKWCKSRNGQTIVCEGEDADWLPFCDVDARYKGLLQKKQPEKIWTNDDEPQWPVGF